MMAIVIKGTNPDNCMPEVARTVKSTSCCVDKEFHAKMRDLKGKFSLDPILLILTTFPNFILEMHKDMYCMHRILHIGKTIGNYRCIMNH